MLAAGERAGVQSQPGDWNLLPPNTTSRECPGSGGKHSIGVGGAGGAFENALRSAPTWIWSNEISVAPCASPMKARMRILASASSALMPAAASAAAPSAVPTNAW